MEGFAPQTVLSIHNDTWSFKLNYVHSPLVDEPTDKGCRGQGGATPVRFFLHFGPEGPDDVQQDPWVEVPKNATNCRCMLEWQEKNVGDKGFRTLVSLVNCTLGESNLLDSAQVDLALQEEPNRNYRNKPKGEDEVGDLVFVVVKGDVVSMGGDAVLLRSCHNGEERLHYLKSKNFVLTGTSPVFKKLRVHLSKEEREAFAFSSGGGEVAARLKVFFDLPFKYNANPSFAPLVGANAGRRWLDSSGIPCEQQLADEGEGQWPSVGSVLRNGSFSSLEGPKKAWKAERTILVRKTKKALPGYGPGNPHVECSIKESLVLLPNANLNVELAELDRGSTRMKLKKGHNLPPEQRKLSNQAGGNAYYEKLSYAAKPRGAKRSSSLDLAPIAIEREETTGAAPPEGNSSGAGNGEGETEEDGRNFAKHAKNSYGTPLYGTRVLLSSQQPMRYQLAESTLGAMDFYGVWVFLSYDSSDVERESWQKPRSCRTLLFKTGKGFGWSYGGRTTMYDELDNELPVATRPDQLDGSGRVRIGSCADEGCYYDRNYGYQQQQQQLQQQQQQGAFLSEGSHFVFVSPPDGIALVGKPTKQSQDWIAGDDATARMKVAKVTYDVILSHASASLREGTGEVNASQPAPPPSALWDGKNDVEDSSDSVYVAVFFVYQAQSVKLSRTLSPDAESLSETTTPAEANSDNFQVFGRFSKYVSSKRSKVLEKAPFEEGAPKEKSTKKPKKNNPIDLDAEFNLEYPYLAGYRKEFIEYLESVSESFGYNVPEVGERFDDLVLCCVVVDKLSKNFKYRLEAQHVSVQKARPPTMKIAI